MFRFLADNDPEFDINRRERHSNEPPILQARNQPLQTYVDLIELGADVKALTQSGDTVLHVFFRSMFSELWSIDTIDTFLEGGENLALLIQAGADPLAANHFGELPQDSCRPILPTHSGLDEKLDHLFTSFPLPSVEKQIFLAFWHQALRICGLLGSKHCHCPAHNRDKMPRQDVKIRFPWRRRALHRSLPYDTFEEEMSAALRGWDKIAARETPLSSVNIVALDVQDYWDERCDRYDKWIQEVLIELQARQKKASSERNINANPSVKDPSRRMEEDDLNSDETQPSDLINADRSVEITNGTGSDENWETNSSSSNSDSEENWVSAPET